MAVGNATTRSVHVKEGWYGPRGGVGPGYVSPEESDDQLGKKIDLM